MGRDLFLKIAAINALESVEVTNKLLRLTELGIVTKVSF
jgi:hypothetical protein